jgi:hypothetical protein
MRFGFFRFRSTMVKDFLKFGGGFASSMSG